MGAKAGRARPRRGLVLPHEDDPWPSEMFGERFDAIHVIGALLDHGAEIWIASPRVAAAREASARPARNSRALSAISCFKAAREPRVHA